MSIQNKWPPLEFDYREDGLSFRKLREPTLDDIVAICDHYDEMLELYGKSYDIENYQIVKDAIKMVRGQVDALAQQDTRYANKMNKVNKIQQEFEILKAGDLEDDEERTPQMMHDRLVQVEGEYVMLQDAIESYKRQVRMLEQSIDPKLDKKLV